MVSPIVNGARHEAACARPPCPCPSRRFRHLSPRPASPGLGPSERRLSARPGAGAGRQDLVRGAKIGAIGIFDPKTGEARHVKLGPRSARHGVIQGPDGAARLTDGGQNAIVRFDPKSEEIRVWKLPEDTGYANLNTAAFDKDGIHWFTGQNGIYGRLDPKSGEVKVFKAPKGRGPYGIAATPDGEVYYVSLAGGFLGKIDRATGETKVIEPPTPNQGARRVWSDSKSRLWLSEWNSGQLSVHDPKDGSWKVWKLPGEKPRNYAVYVDERDIVWMSDWGADAILSFDPKSEKFTS
jgi:virginiamycin B lyase